MTVCGFRAHYRVSKGGRREEERRIYMSVYKYTRLRIRMQTISRRRAQHLLFRVDERARTCARCYKLLRDGEQILVETSERKWGCGGGLIRSFKWKHLVSLGALLHAPAKGISRDWRAGKKEGREISVITRDWDPFRFFGTRKRHILLSTNISMDFTLHTDFNSVFCISTDCAV